jgi:hypothetical protein
VLLIVSKCKLDTSLKKTTSSNQMSETKTNAKTKTNDPSSTGGSAWCVEVANEQSTDFVCTICQHLARDPVVTSCSHMFCKQCLTDWLSSEINGKKQSKCPSCNKPRLTLSDCRAPDALVLRMMNKVLVKCCHAQEGCTWKGEYSNVAKHLSSSCLVCPDCFVVSASTEALQAHLKTCAKAQVRCSTCQQLVPKGAASTHACTFPCRIPSCVARFEPNQEQEHLVGAHSPKEIASLVAPAYSTMERHPFLTGVRCMCGERMMRVSKVILGDSDTRSKALKCMDCNASVSSTECLMCIMSEKPNCDTGYLCVPCSRQPRVRGLWVGARVKMYPGSPFANQSGGNSGTVIASNDLVRKHWVFVRWDNNKGDNWYRIRWSTKWGTDLVLDTDDTKALGRVFRVLERTPYVYATPLETRPSQSAASITAPTGDNQLLLVTDCRAGVYALDSKGGLTTDLNLVQLRESGSLYHEHVPEMVFDAPVALPSSTSSAACLFSSSRGTYPFPPSSVVYHKKHYLGAGIVMDWNTYATSASERSVIVFWTAKGSFTEEQVDALTKESDSDTRKRLAEAKNASTPLESLLHLLASDMNMDSSSSSSSGLFSSASSLSSSSSSSYSSSASSGSSGSTTSASASSSASSASILSAFLMPPSSTFPFLSGTFSMSAASSSAPSPTSSSASSSFPAPNSPNSRS